MLFTCAVWDGKCLGVFECLRLCACACVCTVFLVTNIGKKMCISDEDKYSKQVKYIFCIVKLLILFHTSCVYFFVCMCGYLCMCACVNVCVCD